MPRRAVRTLSNTDNGGTKSSDEEEEERVPKRRQRDLDDDEANDEDTGPKRRRAAQDDMDEDDHGPQDAGIEVEGGGGANDDDYGFAVKLRGLPWNATDKMVERFLAPVRIDLTAVSLLHNQRGEAYVRLTSEEAQGAAVLKDKAKIGRRYIEVFAATPEEVYDAMAEQEQAAKQRQQECGALLKMRGLPWAAKDEDVRKFFGDARVKKGPGGVRFTKDAFNRPSGEAFVTFESIDDAKAALTRDKETIGGRYIDLFTVTEQEMREALAGGQGGGSGGGSFGGGGSGAGFGPRGGGGGGRAFDPGPRETDGSGVVRLHGLPFDATRDDIRKFFAQKNIRVAESAAYVVTRPDGRATGDGFAVFASEEEARKAMVLDKQKMGDRWIDLNLSSRAHLQAQCGNAMVVSDQPDADYSGVLRLRGLPFSAGATEVREFFRGFAVAPDGIYIINGPDMRPSGEAFALFQSEEEATRATELHRKKMGERYIELFKCSKADLYAAITRSAGMFSGRPQGPITCARLRGLPFNVTDQDIFAFFHDLQVIGMFICKDMTGRPTGEGFVEFADADVCLQAMGRNREPMQSRYIEVFACTKDDVLAKIQGGGAVGPPAGGGGGGGRGRGFGGRGGRGRGFGGGGGGYQGYEGFGGRGGYNHGGFDGFGGRGGYGGGPGRGGGGGGGRGYSGSGGGGDWGGQGGGGGGGGAWNDGSGWGDNSGWTERGGGGGGGWDNWDGLGGGGGNWAGPSGGGGGFGGRGGRGGRGGGGGFQGGGGGGWQGGGGSWQGGGSGGGGNFGNFGGRGGFGGYGGPGGRGGGGRGGGGGGSGRGFGGGGSGGGGGGDWGPGSNGDWGFSASRGGSRERW